MSLEAEARTTLVDTTKNLLEDVVEDLDSNNARPLTGIEIDDIVKKLYRASQTLKTAQSLSVV